MDELVYLRNDEAVCSSLQVAEKFEKRHDNVMRSIEGLLKNEETHEMFKNSSYIEEQWKWKKDERTNTYLEEPVPFFDDAMAMLRYSIEGERKAKPKLNRNLKGGL